MITKDVPEFTVATTLEDVVRVLVDHPWNHADTRIGGDDIWLCTVVTECGYPYLKVEQSVFDSAVQRGVVSACSHIFSHVYKLNPDYPLPEWAELIRVQAQLGGSE